MQDQWRTEEVQAHGTAGPLVGWLPCRTFYGSDGWEHEDWAVVARARAREAGVLVRQVAKSSV
jgi:hypothetical protein